MPNSVRAGSDVQQISLPRDARAPERIGPAGLPVGTQIWTSDGILPVEYLSTGDRIVTRDGGYSRLTRLDTVATVVPMVRIAARALGPQRPDTDLILQASQAVLLRDKVARDLTGRDRHVCTAGDLAEAGLADGLGAFPVTLMVLHLRRQDVIYAAGLDVVCGIRGPSRRASARQPAQNIR
ncbi:Hint domain-containing protein [Marinibacterium sp. SX1]|uniref:Hint domain-containing protein n=1 Tax=Marinibacterium sp. SX1 TaxID=3388424 RepID=UPI003D175EA3